MNGLPYYKRYQRDLIEGTAGLPFEIKTTYSFIIDLIYLHDGKLPDDSRYIAGTLGCSVRKWNSIRQALIESGKLKCFTHVSRNFLTNYRAIIELESLRKFQDNQREKILTRWKNNNLADTTVSEKSYHTEPDTDIGVDTSVSTPCAKHDFDEWYSRYPHKVGKRRAQTAFKAASKRATQQQLLDGVERYKQTKPPDRSWLNPATFLNQDRWLDEPAMEEPNEANRPNGKADRRSQELKRFREQTAAEYERRLSVPLDSGG